VYSRDDNSAPAPQAGLIVGRAVGNAVMRNRVKRRLRAGLREHWVGVPPGSLVVRAHAEAAQASFAALRADLERCLKQLSSRAS
jgi:ribonuclease P protein component